MIRFAPNLHGTITLTSGQLSITDSLTISGPGANLLTISGNNTMSGNKASRVFDISGAAKPTVTIAGLTIADGLITGELGGGGILNHAGATLNLTRCSVVNNQATAGPNLDVYGGGLLNLGVAYVTSSTFTGNQVLGGDNGRNGYGGAIVNFGGATLTVTGGTFTSNQAISTARTNDNFYGIGGAIDNTGLDKDHPTKATISNSTFTDNQAIGLGSTSSGNGGAINNEGTGATMNLTNSWLIDNQSIGGAENAGDGGGIVNQHSSTLIVTNSTFIGNQAKGAIVFGGGINNTSAVLTVSASSFFGNKALALSPGGIAAGGGIFNGSIDGPGTLELTNCTISGNQAIGGPGGVAAGGGLDNSFLIPSLLPPDTSFPKVTATITGSLIINNQALGGAGDPGVNGGDGVGGGISVGSANFFDLRDASSLIISDSTIAGNTARGGNGGSGADGGNGLGGGIWFGQPTSPAPQNSIDNSVITGNFALGGQAGAGAGGSDGQGLGGGLYIDGATVHATRTLIKKNSASNHLYNDLFGTLS